MRKFLTTLSLFVIALTALAIPAKPGIWKTLTLNGTAVKAQLMGDEYMHYWQTDDGRQLTEQNNVFVLADMAQLQQRAMAQRVQRTEQRLKRMKRKAIGDFTHYTGSKKGLIILVEFTNMQFNSSNDSLLYTRICNEPGFSEGNFLGSVNDYFKDQSYGKFDLTFDVVGPVLMDSTYQYYGHDVGEQGNDAHPGQMVAAACQAVDGWVNFPDYDWDGDGMVDQVMCIYAGQGQADGGESNTIWPHEWELAESDYGKMLELDGVTINTYACANERRNYGIEGIGTICHEFSHCLGLPDMYDINYGGNYGMGRWSLMDTGSYNGDGFCPSGYSSFDRYTCGWVTPVELTGNQRVEAMQPLEDKPEVYMVRNDGYADEYFLLENRQQKSWDASCPGEGLLILYVDYNYNIWAYNLVNTNYTGGGGYPSNDHQRCTVMRAGGSNGWGSGSGDPYPYQSNDSLTNTSRPAATLHHGNIGGEMLLNKGILNIARNGDGTMSFRFRNTAEEVYVPEGTAFYESFNNCNGTGGNDELWSATIASSNFLADNEGWEVVKPYGGFRCARFGNGSTAGLATTPLFSMDTGFAYLSFRAAGWNKDGTKLSLSVEGNGAVEPSYVTMENFVWNEYKVKLTGTGDLRVTFSPEKRFLLDDVLVVAMQADSTDVIVSRPLTDVSRQANGYYSLDGRYLGTNAQALPRGMYILYTNEDRKGRKVIR